MDGLFILRLRECLHDASHSLWLVFCEVGENFSVEAELVLCSRTHHLGERSAILFCNSGDLGLPESAIRALLLFAVSEGVATCVVQSLFCLCLLCTAAETKTFRGLKHIAAALILYDSSFYA